MTKYDDKELNKTKLFLDIHKNEFSKTYFYSCMAGYFVAIVSTVVIMIIFDHGQPALLYLVPGCILSVCTCALVRGEFSHFYNFNEEIYLTKKEDKKDEKKE